MDQILNDSTTWGPEADRMNANSGYVETALAQETKKYNSDWNDRGIIKPSSAAPSTVVVNDMFRPSAIGVYTNYGGVEITDEKSQVILYGSIGYSVKTIFSLKNISVFDSYNSTYNNVDITKQSVILRKEGISIVYGNTYKTLTGAADYVFTRSGIRKYLYLNMDVLINYAGSVLDYTTTDLLVESQDTLLNNKDYVLLCGFYANELQSGIGLLATIINKRKNYYSNNFQNPLTYIGNRPSDVVEIDTEAMTMRFPSSFTAFSNGEHIVASGEQTISTVCVSYPGLALTASSLGFLVINRDNGTILNVYNADYVDLDNDWVLFGIVKRGTSSIEATDVQISGNFRYSIDGNIFGIETDDEARYDIRPSFYFGSTSNEVIQADTSADEITFPASFTVLDRDGNKYTTAAEQTIALICTFYATGLPAASSTGVLAINKSTLEIRNIYHADWSNSMSDSWLTFGIIKRSTSSSSTVGDVQIIGFFPYLIDGGTNSITSKFIPSPAFYFGGTSNKVVEINTTANTIFFPSGFVVFDGHGNNYTITEDQTVTVRTTFYASGDPATSATGVLVMNTDTLEISNYYWGDWDGALPNNYLTIGFIKRSTASLTEVGDVQVIGFFPYSINGSSGESASQSIVERNLDILPTVHAAIFPKYDGAETVHRFNFLHISDLHNDVTRVANAINYLNAINEIDGLLNTGDTPNSNYAEDVTNMINTLLGTGKPVYPIAGNHCVGNSKTVSICGTNSQVYTKFISPFVTLSGITTGGDGNYWYKDDTDRGIRMVGLYEYDDPNDLDTDPTYYKIQRGMRVFSQTQIDWFISTLNNTPAGYQVIVFMHQNPTTSDSGLTKNSDWDAGLGFNPQNLINGSPVNDIVQAWIDGTTINQSYSFTGDAAYLSNISAIADFSSRGTGIFITYIFGHSHADGAGSFVSYSGQNWIAVTCTSANEQQSQSDDLPRVQGTKTEDAFNLISIDVDAQKIYLVRIGSNVNNEFTDRKKLVLSY